MFITLVRAILLFRDKSIRKNSDKLILFKKTLRDVQTMHQDIRPFDKKYDEFREMGRVAWSVKFNHLCVDMIKNRNEGNYRIFNENKTTYIECVCESEAF